MQKHVGRILNYLLASSDVCLHNLPFNIGQTEHEFFRFRELVIFIFELG